MVFLSLFCAGASGALGVLLLTMTIPPLFKWIQNRYLPSPPPETNSDRPSPPTN
jgi:hypothetical protein